MDATGTERAVLVVAVARARNARCCSRRIIPSGSTALVFIAPALPLPPATPRLKATLRVRRAARRVRRLGEVEPPLLARATTEDFLEFFFSQCFTEPHSTKQTRGLRRLGPRDGRRDARSRPSWHRGSRTKRRARAPAQHRLPGARDPRQRRRDPTLRVGCAARRARRRRAHRPRRVGPPARTHATRSRSICSCATSSRPRSPPRRLGARQVPPQARALRLLADRARPRAARRRDRRRAAQAPSRSRDRLAGAAPGHRGARGARRADPSRPAPSSPTSRTTSRASPPSTTCTASRRSAGWTRSCSPTSWSSTTSSARSSTTSGSATRPGSSTTTCTRTPSRSAPPYVWLTDFVGWLPMPDGGDHEAFLTGDYNEEMIEHIARFPRVRDQARLRRQPRRHRSRAVRVPPPLDPRVDRGALRLRRLRHGLRSGGVRRPRRAQGRARLRRGRAGLHRHRRRLGRRRRSPAASDRRLPGGQGAGAGAADDRRRRAADRPGDAARARRARGPRLRAPTSTGTSPPATSRSSRAA